MPATTWFLARPSYTRYAYTEDRNVPEGLTRVTAAQATAAAGAVYGGLIFDETSKRHVSRETAEQIIGSESSLKYVAVSRRTSGYAERIRSCHGICEKTLECEPCG